MTQLAGTDREARAHPALAWLSPGARDRVLEEGRLVRYRPGRAVEHASAPAHFWVIVDGLLRVHAAAGEGKGLLLHLLQAPALWGDPAALLRQPATSSVTTLLPTKVLRLSPEQLDGLVRTEPAFARALLE